MGLEDVDVDGGDPLGVGGVLPGASDVPVGGGEFGGEASAPEVQAAEVGASEADAEYDVEQGLCPAQSLGWDNLTPDEQQAAIDDGNEARRANDEASRGLDKVLSADNRTFTRYLQSLQSQAAQNGGTDLTPSSAQALWDSAMARGFTAPRGVETEWTGGPHINIYGPGGGPNIHFPVPDGWSP